MADASSKVIEKVNIGDQVLAYDFDRQMLTCQTVCLCDNPERENVVDLQLADGKTISSTTDHPYWVEGKGWCSFDPEMTLSHYKIFLNNAIAVGNLLSGDKLLLAVPPCNENGSVSTSTITLKSIAEREHRITSLWILRVGNYGIDWRLSKKLLEEARLSGNFTRYYKEMEQFQSQETNPNNHNFFANNILVHNK